MRWPSSRPCWKKAATCVSETDSMTRETLDVDILIVGDLFEIVPAMIAELKK
jgi:hypothetical protein